MLLYCSRRGRLATLRCMQSGALFPHFCCFLAPCTVSLGPQIPKTGKGAKASKPVNKDRFIRCAGLHGWLSSPSGLALVVVLLLALSSEPVNKDRFIRCAGATGMWCTCELRAPCVGQPVQAHGTCVQAPLVCTAASVACLPGCHPGRLAGGRGPRCLLRRAN